MVRLLVTSLMTSRDLWCHNLQNCHIRKLGPGSSIRVDPLSTHYCRTFFC